MSMAAPGLDGSAKLEPVRGFSMVQQEGEAEYNVEPVLAIKLRSQAALNSVPALQTACQSVNCAREHHQVTCKRNEVERAPEIMKPNKGQSSRLS
jgi:hypothetical protein